MRLIPLLLSAALVAFAGNGVPPRASASDYQVHQATKNGILAASIIPSKQIEKMFSADIAKQYIVLEVALFPLNAQSFDVDWFDFGLKVGDTVAYVEKPRDVATPWPEKKTSPDKPVTVITDAGVVYSRSNDPVYGRRSGWGTYEGVGVTNDPRAAQPPMPRQGPDPQLVEQRVLDMMLPQGLADHPIAGYLFFPQYNLRKAKTGEKQLQWSKNDASAVLRLPAK
ncbi:MAG TPA: hypothetical protein VGL72_04560 [Bryobacteraceae bacterium]